MWSYNILLVTFWLGIMLMSTFERFMLIDYNLKFSNDYLITKSIFPNVVLVDEYFLSLFTISVLQNPTNEVSYTIQSHK
jgi:hypothetical protein